ncbi:MAG: hypothetical protein KC931_27120, partial [Candidatus Omnitrophica bacterium]|nr:hypothetical protein [Candidatus Omnitrophota bacterium]
MRRSFALLIAIILTHSSVQAQQVQKPENRVVIGTFPQEVSESFYAREHLTKIGAMSAEEAADNPKALPTRDITHIAAADGGKIYAKSDKGLLVFDGQKWSLDSSTDPGEIPGLQPADLKDIPDSDSFGTVYATAESEGGEVAIGAEKGLFVIESQGEPAVRIFPRDGSRSWAPTEVRGVGYDSKDRLWFASPQGVGVKEAGEWSLYTGEDGLPYNDFTCLAIGPDDAVWFGTKIGAIRFDGKTWNYRQGKRW